jgi:competence protein ComEA
MDRSPTTVAIWLVAGVLVLVAGMRLFGGVGGEAAPEPVRLASGGSGLAAGRTGPAGTGRAGPPRVVVHVAGAVRAPGLYRVAQSARVATALARAGGPTRRADTNGVNLAARVQDGQQIVVPRLGTAPGAGDTTAAVKPSLGSATVEQLEELDGIGPELAGRIVDYRSAHGGFRSLDELAEVEGIGEGRLAALREALQP